MKTGPTQVADGHKCVCGVSIYDIIGFASEGFREDIGSAIIS